MRFNSRARLDRSQIQNRRGAGGGGGGFGVPAGGGGLRVGGGIGGIIMLVILAIFVGPEILGGGGGGLTGGMPQVDRGQVQGESGAELEQCRTGADANRDADCARLAVVNSVQSFWSQALPEEAGREYREADTVIFSGQVSTACGGASSQVGPFYCPADEQVYIDTTFFRDMLQSQLGASGGDFAEAYVIAHEYGHHVQNLLGTMGRVRTQQGPTSDAVRLELQADCYAGMWTKFATEAEDENGEVFIVELTQQDISEALDAARAVGDDRIQERSSGRVEPDSWTHGSAEQRMRWFMVGMEQGTLAACDTFSADRL